MKTYYECLPCIINQTIKALPIFNEADLIISKGQGNYETLSENNQNIFFLLKVKCEIVARDLNKNVGDFIVLKNRH